MTFKLGLSEQVPYEVFFLFYFEAKAGAGRYGNHKQSQDQRKPSCHFTPHPEGVREEAVTRMQRWGKLSGKGGHPSRPETFRGAQPKATCKGTRGINTPPLSHPSSNLPSWRLTTSWRARMPDAQPCTFAPECAARKRRQEADQTQPGLVTDSGGRCQWFPLFSVPSRLRKQLMKDTWEGKGFGDQGAYI